MSTAREQPANDRTRRVRRELGDDWKLSLLDGPDDRPLVAVECTAVVPGVVHLDLLREGLIDDPYVDRNEDGQHWIGRSDWSYSCRFAGADGDHDRIDLVFDGLDTVATILLDGELIGRTFNQHRTYRFDVTDRLTGDDHELTVQFASPAVYAEQQRDAIGNLPNPYGLPFNFVRKMACNFGWDWGPRLTTSGIWKPVAVETWSRARLAAVRPTVDVLDGEIGVVDLTVDLEWAGDRPLELVASIGGVSAAVAVDPSSSSARMHLEVPGIERWWPIGRGQPTRYPLVVSIQQDGVVLDSVAKQIGFRTVAIDTTPVDDGTRWAVVVNGERVWVRGTNWIPDDCFPSRVDRGRYERRIDQAIDANVNLLRIWGGGIYESDDFYDLCDEKGVLVWQDFLFACAAYDEPSLHDEVAAEAADAVDRLMSHPSLILWNGNNENHWGWWSWGWPDDVGDRTWGLGFYEELLPAIVGERDPGRPYLEGSPSSGDVTRHPNDQDHGPMHIWKIWNEVDYLHYRDYRPRFVSEFGFQGPPTHATLARSITSRPLAADNRDLLHHQKAFEGHQKLARGLEPHFEEPTDFDDWHYLTQLNQARAITVGVRHLRRLHERCAGAVLWQLNDCWPVVSWAVVDGDERLKLAWYALRESFADRLLVLEPDGDGVALFLVNDTRQNWDSTVRLRRFDIDGTVVAEHQLPVDVAADGSFKQLLPASLGEPDDLSRSLLVADVDGRRAVHTWSEDRDLEYGPARFTTSVVRHGTTTRLRVTAEAVLRDLCVLADRLDPAAVVDSQMITLVPGESHTFVIDSGRDLGEALVSRPVLRCVNDRV